jgi:molecular chaperone HscB
MTPDYFAYYGFEPSLELDENELRRRYLEKSRQYHPDYYAHAHPDEQSVALVETAFNNAAFNELKDREKRTAHVLRLFGLLDEAGSPVETIDLGKDFLMAMMDAGEALEAHPEPDVFRRSLAEEWLAGEAEARQKAVPPTRESLMDVAKFYLRRKYLNRLGA